MNMLKVGLTLKSIKAYEASSSTYGVKVGVSVGNNVLMIEEIEMGKCDAK